MLKLRGEMEGDVEQFNGREGETATLLSRCPLNFGGLGGGFAPRHLSRWAFRGKIEADFVWAKN